MKVFAQLSKVDVEKRLVYGRAAQETPDHSGEVMDYLQSKPNFVKWSAEMSKATNGASQGNIRAMHGNVAAGKVQELIYSDDEHAIDVVAKIIDENEWQKVLEGVYTGFSIGGKYGARVKKGDFTHYEALPTEISLVDRPCIPTATFFDIQKSDGSVMQKQFQSLPDDLTKGAIEMPATKQAEQEYEVVGTAEEANALAKMLHDNKMSIGDAVKVIEKATGVNELEKAYWADIDTVAALLKADYPNEDLFKMDTEQRAALVDLEKLAPFADTENGKYPIDSPSQVKAAWGYINKNADKYTPEALAIVKANIVAAWKDKVDATGPEVEKMVKGLSAVGMLGDMLQSLYYLASQCAREAANEGDGSDIPARLGQVVQDVAAIYKDMASEEAEELIADMMTNIQPEQVDVMQMAYGLAGALAKAGARNSAADADMIQKMHDLSGKLGANCAINDDTGAAAGAGTDQLDTADSAVGTNIQMVSQKSEATGDLEKSLGEDALAKALEPLNKALSDAMEKIAKLEAQPMPSKGVLRVVDKASDAVTKSDVKEIAPVVERNGEINEAASMFKKIHSNGGTPLIGGFRNIN